MNRSTFTLSIAALRVNAPGQPTGSARYQPTTDEADTADALQILQEHHFPAGMANTCPTCVAPWPCEAWGWGEQLAVQWLGRAADRNYAHARSVMNRSPRRPA